MKIAVLGGTGSFGGALARRLVTLGEDEIVIGSRDAARAEACAAEFGDATSGAANLDAVSGVELVVLAVVADAALATAAAIAPALEVPLLSVASVLSFTRGGVIPDPDALSLAERIQQLVRVPVSAGLHSVAASNLGEAAAEEDAFVCGDDAAGKALALTLAGKLVSGRALDAGPLASARTLEGLTAVIVNLNRRYRGHAGITVTGLPSA